MRVALVAAFLASFVALSLAQTDPNATLVDPGATCPQETRDSITACLAQVEQDEATRSGGPCTSTDWQCICNKQYGLIACFDPCPGIQDVDAVNFNNNACMGQNGVSNANVRSYSGAPLTTTAPNGATGSSGVPGASTSMTSTSAPATTSSSQQTSAPSSSTSRSTSAAASSSAAPANAAAARGIDSLGAAAAMGVALLAGALL